MPVAPVRLGIKGKGVDEDDGFRPLVSAIPEDDGFRPEGDTYYGPGAEGGLTPYKVKKKPAKGASNYADDIIEFLRPLAAVGAVGGTIGAMSKLPQTLKYLPQLKALAGATAGFGTDAAVQKTLSKPPENLTSRFTDFKPGSPESTVTDTGEMLLGNELGGRVVGTMLNGLKEFFKPGAVVAYNDIMKLSPTYSQLKEAIYSKAPVSKWIEDVLGSGAKTRAIENSKRLGKIEGENLAAGISGISKSVTSSPQVHTKLIEKQFESNRLSSIRESNGQAMSAKLIAKNNPVLVGSPGNPAMQPNPLTVGGLPLGTSRIVEGPIFLDNTLDQAQKYLLDKQKVFGDLTKNIQSIPKEDQPIVLAAQNLLKVSDAQINSANGQIIGHQPISFEDAWNFKQTMDAAFTRNKSAAQFSQTLNKDIDTSIPQWQQGSQRALSAWHNAKETVRQRIELFESDTLSEFIENSNSAKPIIDRVLKDPYILQRQLSSGELKFPSGSIKSTNMRRDLQGYVTQQLLNDPKRIETLASQDNKEVYGLLFSQQNRADVGQFFKNLAITHKKQTLAGNYIVRVALYKGGVAIPAALLAGATHGTGAAIGTTAVVIGGMGLARMLTNPKLARPLVALSAGQPAGVSDQYLSRALVGALQGAGNVIRLIDQQGQETKAAMGPDGELVSEER